MKKEWGLRYIDDDTQGWQVTVQRAGKIYNKFFTDRRHGGKRKSREAALAYRDHIDKTVPRPSRAAVMNKLRPNNTSGTPGVHYARNLDRKGRVTMFWIATWVPEIGGRRKSRKFSMARYGEKKAKQLAITARRKALEPLEQEPYRVTPSAKPRSLPAARTRVETVRFDFRIEKGLAAWISGEAERQGISRSKYIAGIFAAERRAGKTE